MVKIQDISIRPLSEQQKLQYFKNADLVKIIHDSSDNLSSLGAIDAQLFFTQLLTIVSNYIVLYNRVWNKFNKSFSIEASVGKTNRSSQISNLTGPEKDGQEFLRVLEKGTYLLKYIREIVTGQEILTKFVVESNGQIEVLSEENTNFNLAFSTYNSSYNNFVSLGYQDIEKNINLLSQEVRNNQIMKTESIYSKIMSVKVPYLINYKDYSQKEAEKAARWNWKDSEILSHYLQSGVNVNRSLTVKHYADLRKTIQGHNVTALQSGDQGLEQIKYIKTKQVAFMRQTMIIKNFKKLELALQDLQNYNQLKDTFKNIFTIESQKRAGDKITRKTNIEAKKHIDELFQTLLNT